MNVSTTAVLLVACSSLATYSQAQGSLPQRTLSAFRSASKLELSRLAARFDLKDDWRGYVCQDFASPAAIDLFRGANEEVVAIEVKSLDCQAAFLLTYWHEKGQWLYGGTIRLDERYGRHPHYEAMELVSNHCCPVIVPADRYN